MASSRGVSSSPPANASRIRSSIRARRRARDPRGRWRARHRAPRRRTSRGRRRGLAAATARRDVLDERRAARLVAERHVRERGGRVPSQRRAGRDKRVARARRAPAAGGALTRAGLTRGLHRFLRAAHPERGGRDEEARERARGGCARLTGEPKGHFASSFSHHGRFSDAPRRALARLAPASVFVLLVQSIIQKRPPPPRASPSHALAVSTFHTMMIPSSPPDTSVLPSALNVTLRTGPQCECSAASSLRPESTASPSIGVVAGRRLWTARHVHLHVRPHDRRL